MKTLFSLCAAVPAACLCYGLASAGPEDGHPNIWNFQGHADGSMPRGSLLADSQGTLYGTTSFGGTQASGNVFKLVPPADGQTVNGATVTDLYNFTGGADGSLPSAALVADRAGNLYGTAALDGANLGGVVFELQPPTGGGGGWTESTLWSFGGAGDGRNPVGDLLRGADGSLYGTTNWGGENGYGTVFKLSPPAGDHQSWTETILWSFSGGVDGSQPVAALTMDGSGILYGTTKLGGASRAGTVFSLTPPAAGSMAWTETVVWSFTGGNDGSEPSGNLLLLGDGALYGMTTFGGSTSVNCAQARFPYYGEPQSINSYALGAPYVPAGGDQCGTVFKLVPSATAGQAGQLTTLYAFTGEADGGTPFAGLLQLPDGSLAGYDTELSANFFYGVAFKLEPPAGSGDGWTETTLVPFNGQQQGLYAMGTPILGVAGQIYGTQEIGGDTWRHARIRGWGTAFTVDPNKSRR